MTEESVGNVDQQKGALQSALRKYEMATKLYPLHPYAWHDIFSVNSELAQTGQADVPQMRVALDEVKRLAEGQPGLSNAHIAQMDAILADLES